MRSNVVISYRSKVRVFSVKSLCITDPLVPNNYSMPITHATYHAPVCYVISYVASSVIFASILAFINLVSHFQNSAIKLGLIQVVPIIDSANNCFGSVPAAKWPLLANLDFHSFPLEIISDAECLCAVSRSCNKREATIHPRNNPLSDWENQKVTTLPATQGAEQQVVPCTNLVLNHQINLLDFFSPGTSLNPKHCLLLSSSKSDSIDCGSRSPSSSAWLANFVRSRGSPCLASVTQRELTHSWLVCWWMLGGDNWRGSKWQVATSRSAICKKVDFNGFKHPQKRALFRPILFGEGNLEITSKFLVLLQSCWISREHR